METSVSDTTEADDDLSKLNLNDKSSPSEVKIIVGSGDVLLRIISDDTTEEVASYRVSSVKLISSSPYFERLLSTKYAEGSRVAQQLSRIRDEWKDGDFSRVAINLLPVVEVCGIGEIGPVKSIAPLMAEFLRILHGINDIDEDNATTSKTIKPTAKSSSTPQKRPPKETTPQPSSPATPRRTPIVNVANLAIVADRFDAAPVLLQASMKQRWLPNAKLGPGQRKLTEEQIRHRLLVGVLLNYEPWLAYYSAQLILTGSVMWGEGEDDGVTSRAGLWWDLPRGVEEELALRRVAILSSIQALQNHLLYQYASRVRTQQQCRLGYDTSPQCDSFQLGEFVKHLVKVGTLQLGAPTLFPDEKTNQTRHVPCVEYAGNINGLIASLRAMPSHQVNNHHAHCGPKKQLIAGLDYLDGLLVNESCIGICGSCWFDARTDAEGKSWSAKEMRGASKERRSNHSQGMDREDLDSLNNGGQTNRKHGMERNALRLNGSRTTPRTNPLMGVYLCKAGKGKEHERANACFRRGWDWARFLGTD